MALIPGGTLTEALDNIAAQTGTPPSKTLYEAIGGIQTRVSRPFYGLDLTVGPKEEVLILNATGLRKLSADPPADPAKPGHFLEYYFLDGTFTDLTGVIPGTGNIKSVLSWYVDEVGSIVFNFPDPSLAGPPYDRPPQNGYKGVTTGGETLGVTKTLLEFHDGSTLVSIGVNQTKLAAAPDFSSAQLYETNTEVISVGTGRFAGAKGLVTSDLGYYFDKLLPLDPANEPYKSGYKPKIFIFIRLST